MCNSPLDLDLFELNLNLPELKAIAQLLDYTESLIDPGQQPEAIASLYDLKNQITQLKSQKGKTSSQKIVPNYSVSRIGEVPIFIPPKSTLPKGGL